MMGSISIWAATRPRRPRPALEGDLRVDVVIVGAGITGLTAALLLAKTARSVAAIEARAVGAGDSGGSTGNLYQTVTGGLETLAAKCEADTARAVVASRGEAIAWIEQQAQAMGPSSGFRRCPMYQYPLSPDAEPTILGELKALRAAGLDAQLASEMPPGLPAAKGAVLLLSAQAQFHPIGYLHALALQAEHAGARLFENSPALELDLEVGVVRTRTGTAFGHHIVLATHSPLGFHLVQAGMAVRREYGLAFHEQAVPAGIFWAQAHPRLSVRGLEANGKHYLLCIGEHHETGRHDAAAALAQLERAAQEYLAVGSPVQRWSAQHFHSPDGLPYIGRDESGAFIATGFSTDGLVYGTVAAHIITDQIIGAQSRWSSLYLGSLQRTENIAR
ncbi:MULTISPECIES: NAD(P)/FAD-dependent oxidoreductase [Cupriavidus]|uniref:FAD-binding oxidoreductase n=1 Tax=Cupriavidus gilardii TaxID=82541 RepID=A0A849BRX3_9BURK|nr:MULTISPECIES: FAD-dependent oxidoreductase [Cupriavidus]KAB0595227.1 FAD-binding oxidoreductase [Cupriavidus gilardii]MCT9015605.1 FAD-binding oxidoreductase [Cupriavidus gilardii]MCT9055375.1 FAD-binding oxidoreductase [Cupriavidus gilardii]NNH13269.1 FAD-binding oxidoreductase [Cupriavidus gilardii]USE81770.1 FAD-binding oxidoreductase [Cupriavidus gilardii]